MSEHPWDWFSLFLASAAISSLYYIANPSDHSTKTRHLFRNPPFMQTLSWSSNKIRWWIARNIHLVTSHPSLREDGSAKTEAGQKRALSPRRHVIVVKSDGPVCPLSVFPFAGLTFIRPSMQMLLSSSSKAAAARPDATPHQRTNSSVVYEVYVWAVTCARYHRNCSQSVPLPSGTGGFFSASVWSANPPSLFKKREMLSGASKLLTNFLLKSQRRHMCYGQSLLEVALELKAYGPPWPGVQYLIVAGLFGSKLSLLRQVNVIHAYLESKRSNFPSLMTHKTLWFLFSFLFQPFAVVS